MLYLDEAAAQPILDRFRPGATPPAEDPVAAPGTTAVAPEPSTTTTPTPSVPGAVPDADQWVQATAPDGTPCP